MKNHLQMQLLCINKAIECLFNNKSINEKILNDLSEKQALLYQRLNYFS